MSMLIKIQVFWILGSFESILAVIVEELLPPYSGQSREKKELLPLIMLLWD
jgi:hypothetical protein